MTDCIAGKYVEITGSDEETDCVLCGLGKYSTVVGSFSHADCTDCVAGTYIDVTGSDEPTDCIACGAGRYRLTPGADEPVAVSYTHLTLPTILLV